MCDARRQEFFLPAFFSLHGKLRGRVKRSKHELLKTEFHQHTGAGRLCKSKNLGYLCSFPGQLSIHFIQSFPRSNRVAMYATFAQFFLYVLLLVVILILIFFHATGFPRRGKLDTSYIDEERTLYLASVSSWFRATLGKNVYEWSESVAQHIHLSLTVYFISFCGWNLRNLEIILA